MWREDGRRGLWCAPAAWKLHYTPLRVLRRERESELVLLTREGVKISNQLVESKDNFTIYLHNVYIYIYR